MKNSRRLLCGAMATVLLATSAATAAKPTAKALPRQIREIKNLKLGQSVAQFMADYSAEEKETTTKGLRIFTVRVNTLPGGVTALRCEFLDSKLVLIQAQLDPKIYSEQSWTTFIAPNVAQFGTPQSVTTILGRPRLHGARLVESISAGWSDRGTTLIYGRQRRDAGSVRDPNAPPIYVVALIDAKYVSQVSGAVKAEEEREIASEQATQQKREADAAEAKRTQETKDAEAKRVQEAKDAEMRRVLAEKEAEAKRLREEADRAKKESQDEANRLQAEAEKAKRELQDLKDAAERVRRKQAAEQERQRIHDEAMSRISVSSVAAQCVPDGRVFVRCQVRSDATVAVVANVSVAGTAHFENGLFSSPDDIPLVDEKPISLVPSDEKALEFLISTGNGRNCNDAQGWQCRVTGIEVQDAHYRALSAE